MQWDSARTWHPPTQVSGEAEEPAKDTQEQMLDVGTQEPRRERPEDGHQGAHLVDKLPEILLPKIVHHVLETEQGQ